MVFIAEELDLSASITFLKVVAAVIFLYFAYNRYGTGLSKIPGPFIASVTEIWGLIHGYLGNAHQDYLLFRKYNSDILRIGPKRVVVSDPAAIKAIYGFKRIFKKVSLEHTHSLNKFLAFHTDNIHLGLLVYYPSPAQP